MSHDLLIALQNETIDAIKSLGVKHVRSLQKGELSSYTDNAGAHRMPLEYRVDIELAFSDALDGHCCIGVRERVISVVQETIYNYNASISAEFSSVPQVVALRDLAFYPRPNLTGVISFFISFYENCAYYKSQQSGENIYLVTVDNGAPATVIRGFDSVMQALRDGKRIRRESWRATWRYILLVPGSPKLTVDADRPLARAGVPVGTVFSYAPHIDLFRTVNGESYFGPWIPSQDDILADDWYVLE